MCGLIGYSGNVAVDPEDISKLLISAQARGRHSTGVYGAQAYRRIGAASEFVKQPPFESALKNATVVVGHTRYGTMGRNDDKTKAHPLKIGEGESRVYGTHNGALFPEKYESFLKRFGLEDPGLDSLALYQALAKNKFDMSILQHAFGTMALAFTDRQRLYLYRRSNKPLYTGRKDFPADSKDKDSTPLLGLFYASQASYLRNIDCTDIKELPTDVLHIYDKGVLVGTSDVPKNEVSDHVSLDSGLTGWSWSVPDHLLSEDDELSSLVNRYSSYHSQRSQGVTSASRQHNSDWVRQGIQKRLDAKKHGKKPERVAADKALESLASQVRESVVKSRLHPSSIEPMQLSPVNQKYFFTSCYLTIRLQDCTAAKDGEFRPLPYFLVTTKKPDDANDFASGVTDDHGNTVIKLLPKEIERDVELLIYAPLSRMKNYYSVKIKAKDLARGRVLEVTLQLPFRKESEKEKMDVEARKSSSPCAKHSLEGGSDRRTCGVVTGEDEYLLVDGTIGDAAQTEAATHDRVSRLILQKRNKEREDILISVPLETPSGQGNDSSAESSLKNDAILERGDFDSDEDYEQYCEELYEHFDINPNAAYSAVNFRSDVKEDINEAVSNMVKSEKKEAVWQADSDLEGEELASFKMSILLTEKQYRKYAKDYDMEKLLSDANEMKNLMYTIGSASYPDPEAYIRQVLRKHGKERYKKTKLINLSESSITWPETEDWIDTMVKNVNQIESPAVIAHNLRTRLDDMGSLLAKLRDATDITSTYRDANQACTDAYNYVQSMYSELNEYLKEVKEINKQIGQV